MGAGGSTLSTNHRIWKLEPPPLPAPPFLITNEAASEISNPRISQVLEDMPEIIPHKTKAPLISTRHEIQVPNFYDSPGRDDTWHQRSTFHNSSNLHSNQQSLTLDEPPAGFRLSYAPSSNRVTMEYSIQQERLEWSRTISHLAAANQQLATAYSSTLKHLEELYSVLKKGSIQNADITNVNYNKASTSEETSQKHKNVRKQIEDDNGVVRRSDRSDRRHLRRGRIANNSGRHALSLKSKRARSDKTQVHRKAVAAVLLRKNIQPRGEELNQSEESIDMAREQKDLRKEIEELKYLRWETQQANLRLMEDLEAQKQTVQKLKEDCQLSKNQYEMCASDRDEKVDELCKQLDLSKREISWLQKELDTFQDEKDTARVRISNLEKELNDLRMENEKIRKEENDKYQALQLQLTKEICDKDKQIEAFKDVHEKLDRIKSATVEENQVDNKVPGSREKELNDATSNSGQSSIDEIVTLDEFKKEMLLKREARQRAIAAVSSEMDRLRQELDAEKVAHSETSKVLELLKAAQTESSAHLDTQDSNTCDNNTHAKSCSCERNLEETKAIRLKDLLKVSNEITNQMRFQLEKMDDLRYQLEIHPDQHRLQINTLQKLGEDMRVYIKSRECQISVLKDRLAYILVKLSDNTLLDENDDIRSECQRQVDDLAKLRRLCQVRSKTLAELADSAIKDFNETKGKLESVIKHHDEIEQELRNAEEKMDVQDGKISNLESQLGLAKADCRDLQSQMSVINSLFTQMLLGASSSELDLDRLTQLLQENHELISDITKANNAEALPKLLLELIEQVDGRSSKGQDEKKEEDDIQEENIAHNLPKVWRILMELLSCYEAGTPNASATSSSAPDSCYKSVDTPSGPRLVISVSKTYIRLKELILEKKHLEKEMNRMKQLNSHLENKLVEQEKRLSTVSDELTKTWTIVDRMQAQHQQLHTHEKILRYELQQKRKMLQELKQELEYCREKWESARQKNTNTEIEWRSLRREFAARKAISQTDSINSGESGFSDDTDEDDLANRTNVGRMIRLVESRRRIKILKDDCRAATPDTESEQPTDNELSESKTVSSVTSEQRTSTPEIEIESSMMDRVQTESFGTSSQPDVCSEIDSEVIDPLDRALTNVIRNLIKIDKVSYTGISQEDTSTSSESSCTDLPNNSNDFLNDKEIENKDGDVLKQVEKAANLLPSNCSVADTPPEQANVLIDQSNVTEPDKLETKSVFSIGPFFTTRTNVEDAASFFGCQAANKEFNESPCSPETSITPNDMKYTDKCSETTSEIDNTSLDSHSSLDTVKECPSGCSREGSNCAEDTMDSRAARLKRLEEQTEWLVKKMSATNRRGSALNNRLEELHETYGTVPTPPTLPDVLPTFRIPTESNTTNDTNIFENNDNSPTSNDTS